MTTAVISAKRRLRDQEEIIESSYRSYIDSGMALYIIRTERLYVEDGYESFEAYCKHRWNGLSRSRANQMIDAAILVRDMQKSLTGPEMGLPKNESHAAAIMKYATTPDDRQKLWEMACKMAADERVTASIIGKAAKKLWPQAKKPSKPRSVKKK